jgi:uncharacterized delta-60 repeat protein
MMCDRHPHFASCAAFVLAGVALTFPTKSLAQAGQLDKTFGKAGIVLGQNAGLSQSIATAVAIQSDGKILVAGQTPTLQAGVFRFTSAGALDTTFGSGGVAVIPRSSNLGALNFLATGVIVQSTIKIVLAISAFAADAAPRLELARFNADGSVDTSFGQGGIIQLLRGGSNPTSIAQQPDGKILLAGGSLLMRTDANANLDTGFGTDGFAPLISPAGTITIQTNGQIVVGTSRYDANGALDITFGIFGMAAAIEPISNTRLQNDGKIVGVGGLNTKVAIGQLPFLNTVTGIGVMRFTSTGSIDTTFGHEGGAITDFRGVAPTTTPSALVIQANGDIIVAGQAAQPDVTFQIPGPSVFALARFTSAGQLDPAFGIGGKITTNFGSTLTATIAAAALDSSGRLVVAGNVSSGGNAGNLVLARYLTQ